MNVFKLSFKKRLLLLIFFHHGFLPRIRFVLIKLKTKLLTFKSLKMLINFTTHYQTKLISFGQFCNYFILFVGHHSSQLLNLCLNNFNLLFKRSNLINSCFQHFFHFNNVFFCIFIFLVEVFSNSIKISFEFCDTVTIFVGFVG
jgi:hypothetical protein